MSTSSSVVPVGGSGAIVPHSSPPSFTSGGSHPSSTSSGPTDLITLSPTSSADKIDFFFTRDNQFYRLEQVIKVMFNLKEAFLKMKEKLEKHEKCLMEFAAREALDYGSDSDSDSDSVQSR